MKRIGENPTDKAIEEFAKEYEPCKKGKWYLYQQRRREVKKFWEHFPCVKCQNHLVGQIIIGEDFGCGRTLPPIFAKEWKKSMIS